VHEKSDRDAGAWNDLVAITASGERSVMVSGTLIGPRHRPWVVGVLDYEVELELGNEMLVLEYQDVPGMVGRIGTALGEADINIAKMAVSRSDSGAIMLVTTDSPCDRDFVEQLVAGPEFDRGRVVRLRG
jgi:D-3-phosphoglycerate dehydrogenase